MASIPVVTLDELECGSRTRPMLGQLAATYMRQDKSRYVVLAKHPKLRRLELVITSDSLGEVQEWMQQHKDKEHLAFQIT